MSNENAVKREDIPQRPELWTTSFWIISILVTIFTGGFGLIACVIWGIHLSSKAKKWDRQYGHLNLDRVEIAEAS